MDDYWNKYNFYKLIDLDIDRIFQSSPDRGRGGRQHGPHAAQAGERGTRREAAVRQPGMSLVTLYRVSEQ